MKENERKQCKKKERTSMHATLYSTHSSSLGFFGSMLKEIALRYEEDD